MTTRASALELLGFVQNGASRLHQQLHQLSVSLAAPHTEQSPIVQVGASPTGRFRSAFVSQLDVNKSHSHVGVVSGAATTADRQLDALSIDGVVLLVASYLDGASLARLQAVSTNWRAFILQHREPLFSALLDECRVFGTVIRSSSVYKSFLFSQRHALDLELAHTRAIAPTHAALEAYCASTEQHGFVAMFCDLLEFRDPQVARFVAWKRQSALSMVLAATPEHVMQFRKRSSYVGPITFVPVDNPHWPEFEPPAVAHNVVGFRGYAFDYVVMVPGYEALKDTVVKSILKELMLFDTDEHAAAYGHSVGRMPYAAILDGSDERALVEGSGQHLTFSSPLRRSLTKFPVAERIRRLQAQIQGVDDSISFASRSST